MTTPTGGPTMDATESQPLPGTPKLNKALASVQAVLPNVGKDETASIPGKDGRQGYKYSYADLTACSAAIMPLLGKNGLAFTALPTLDDQGKFVLAYKLVHESGEELAGTFPLASSGRPQDLGSLITYYRRYALCAVTGIAPGGEDNDAATANEMQQYDSPRQARPQPQQNGNGKPAAGDPRDEAAIADWGTRIDGFTCQEDADKADAELREVFKAGKMNPTTANAIRHAIKAKASKLPQPEMAGAPS